MKMNRFTKAVTGILASAMLAASSIIPAFAEGGRMIAPGAVQVAASQLTGVFSGWQSQTEEGLSAEEFVIVYSTPQADGTYSIAVEQTAYQGGSALYYGTGTLDPSTGVLAFQIVFEQDEGGLYNVSADETRGEMGYLYCLADGTPMIQWITWLYDPHPGEPAGLATTYHVSYTALSSYMVKDPSAVHAEQYAYFKNLGF